MEELWGPAVCFIYIVYVLSVMLDRVLEEAMYSGQNM
jgi:hypothetical protein